VAKFTAGPVGREFSFATPKETGREHQNTATIAVPVANKT
jgi:hypothetical protein